MLVPLFSTKHLEELPLLSSMHPTPHDEALFHYCPCTRQGAGNYQHSLAAAADTSPADNLQEETRACVNLVLKSMPASEQSLKEIKQYQESDETCHAITNFCQLGWPSEKDLSPKLRKYFPMTAEFTVKNNLLLRGSRILIPPPQCQNIQSHIHRGHQEIMKCRERPRNTIWWPGIARNRAIGEPLQDLHQGKESVSTASHSINIPGTSMATCDYRYLPVEGP